MMITVYTKNELKRGWEAKEKHIIIKGELAETTKAKTKRKRTFKKVGIGTAVVGAAAIIVAPYTAGTSLAIGAGTMRLTIGTVAVSAGELVLLLGFGLGVDGFLKGYNVKFNLDGCIGLSCLY